MQRSGIPTKTFQKGDAERLVGTAARRTFQIKTFRTELKNHVMIMDFVKSNWFPAQRRAKVCVIHMCQGLKTAEPTASRYEIHSRLFSSPRDHAAWERNESLSNTGLRDSTNDQIALRNLQPDIKEKKSIFAEETLASQNAKMISSIVISQLIDETKSRGNGAALLGPRAVAQPRSYHLKQSLANDSAVVANRAFAFLPERLGMQTSGDGRGPGTELLPQGEALGGSPRKGFASITITARRVGPPASTLVWEAVGDPLCTKCGAEDALLRDSSVTASGFGPPGHHRAFVCTEFSRNGSVVRLKFPEAHTGLCEGHEYWITNVDHKDDRLSPGSSPSGEGPLVFSNCVHLRVAQRCPNPICHSDRPLFGPVGRPHTASPQIHRSVLSLSLHCSSHRLTADGVDGIANGGPVSSALQRGPAGGSQPLPARSWTPGLQEGFLQQSPSLEHIHLGHNACPWSGSSPLEDRELAEVGTSHVTVRKGKGQSTRCHTSGQASQLSIHVPGWSYGAVETKAFSGSSKKQPGEMHVTFSAPPVAQTPVKDFLPNGAGPASGACQSSNLSEPAEGAHQCFLRPTVPLPVVLCSLQALSTSPQEDSDVGIKRELPEGGYRCCDLVVKIKECKKGEDSNTLKPEPVPPEPAPPREPETPDLPEDCSEPQQTPASSLTLQEALEVHKPQFISRSQERLKKVEHMVQQRKAQRDANLGQKQSLLPVRVNKKQFTVPHPLSDNLFKPKERFISEKEMHMRSKRIYNNLPEVKKKKEEQKKRVILQRNRLRAEVFKKQLLDQLLQRNAV
ncbi:(E2-independent) E3 ubiquitin-conjugating enzyme FATS isoform X3 [Choloepus didactylus]|uniref:(E2-independent) E3 ubiquitin-conjugating enzyme FATS isoform X3 n=1 Tax=Choloepus didactylus TaxID=27675 RepID=UPI00189E96A2|nr:(E2-independent) E3 ubiquitin-conjugating enzyme FATS isoform X3 [Choloepus didactylus]